MLCLIMLSLMSIAGLKAQKNNQVVYTDYSHYEKDILALLKKDGTISSFKSMAALKESSKAIAANAVVPVNWIKARKHKIEASAMVARRKASVLMVCKFLPETPQPAAQMEKVVFFASATVLSEDGICLTNYHVLRSMIDENMKLRRVDSILFVSTGPGKIYPISAILAYNKTADMALFKIETGGDLLTPVPLGEDLVAGATVHALTHPEGYLYFYAKGVVSRTISRDAANPFTNRTEITADYAKGSSGGPILDDYGNLIAMVSTTNSIYYTDRPQMNLQMVVKETIPISSIRKMIK